MMLMLVSMILMKMMMPVIEIQIKGSDIFIVDDDDNDIDENYDAGDREKN